MQRMMKEAQKMAAEVQRAQEQLADVEVEGSAGGGVVKVRATGDLRILSVDIDGSFFEDFDADDVDMLGDTITAAVNDAMGKARDLQEQTLGPIAGGMGGLGLGGPSLG